MSCAGKWDYISIRGKPWDRRIQWLGEGVKSKHKGTSPLHCKVTASAKPEMKPDSFNKMSISPRRVEHFKDLGKSRLRRPTFQIVRIHEMSRAPLALQYFANITAVVSSRVCGFINGKKNYITDKYVLALKFCGKIEKHWCNQRACTLLGFLGSPR